MWLLTTRGFYSTVEDHHDPSRLLVRARVRADLEALADLVPDLVVQETPDRDYRFRASLARRHWADAVGRLTAEIDYPNFKDAVGQRQGYERAGVYGDVWGTLLALEEGGRYR